MKFLDFLLFRWNWITLTREHTSRLTAGRQTPNCALISRYWMNTHQSPFPDQWQFSFTWLVNKKSLRGQVILERNQNQTKLKLKPGDIGRDQSQDCLGSAKFQTEGGRSNLRGCQQYYIFLQGFFFFFSSSIMTSYSSGKKTSSQYGTILLRMSCTTKVERLRLDSHPKF